MTLALISFTILLSYVSVIFLEFIFLRYKLFIDNPNDRNIHINPIPSAGGLAIFFSYFIYLYFLSYFFQIDIKFFTIFLITLFPIMLIGLVDDLKETKVIIRLFIQLFSASLMIYYFQINQNYNSNFEFSQTNLLIILLSVVLSMWLMNLYNFMDGIDAYAASETVFVFSSASLIAYLNEPSGKMYIILIGFAAASFGFLLRNWYPAKIFMGDTGSVSIGCCAAFFIFYSASESIISIYTWLILLSVFISDSTYTLFVRVVTQKNLLKPHLTHGFHILAKKSRSQKEITKYMIFVNLFWVLPLAVISNSFNDFHILVTIIAYLPLLLYLIKIGAGLEDTQRR